MTAGRRLDGNVVVVTGAASGIGAATARHLVDRGATIAALDRSTRGLDSTLAALGGNSLRVITDLADQDAVARVVPNVVRDCGRVDALVNCAGIVGPMDQVAAVDAAATRGGVRGELHGPASPHPILRSVRLWQRATRRPDRERGIERSVRP